MAQRATSSWVFVAFATDGDAGHKPDRGVVCACERHWSADSSPSKMTSPTISVLLLMATSPVGTIHVWWTVETLVCQPTGARQNDVAIRIALGDEAWCQPPASCPVSLQPCDDLGDEAAQWLSTSPSGARHHRAPRANRSGALECLYVAPCPVESLHHHDPPQWPMEIVTCFPRIV